MTRRKHVNAIFTFDKNVSQFLTDATTFYTAITTTPGSTYISVPPATMTAAQARITTARAAEAAVGTGTMGLAAARDLAVSAVEADVRIFQSMVQNAATSALDVATAITIVTECGLVTKRVTSRAKPEFEVVNDAASVGIVGVTFKAVGNGVNACYETQLSTDNVNWATVKISPTSNYSYAHGMALGTKLYFRGRIILSDEKGGIQSWITPPDAFIFTL